MFPRRPRRLLAALCFAGFAATPAFAAPNFETWLDGVRMEARERGLKSSTIETALSGLIPIPRVIELDRKQPEFTMTFDDYMSRVASRARIQKGRRLLRENRALLDEISKRFRVQPRYILALWGIETDFGRVDGGFKVVQAVATLAFDGRRSAYFRKELFNALTILDEGHITAANMKGSWAGAMGQNQFMPSSFLRYAVDYDGDGRRNIWTSRPDVFASSANYLSKVGWRGDQTWGRPVRLPAGFDASRLGLKVSKPLPAWQALGVRRADGSDLPRVNISASVLKPGGDGGPAFVVYNNYRNIMKWNRSHFFAMAVGRLSDGIGGR